MKNPCGEKGRTHTERRKQKCPVFHIHINCLLLSKAISLSSSTMTSNPKEKNTSPSREVMVSPLDILSNSIFFSPNGKELEPKINMAHCIAENSETMREWWKAHEGEHKVKCIFDGTVIPRKMNSCKMSRIDKWQFEKDMIDVLKKDMRDMEKRDEEERKQTLRKLGNLKRMKAWRGNDEWVREMKKNITVYTNETDIFDKKYTCRLILKSPFHLTYWKEIYATVGHVYCSVYWSGESPTMLDMAGTKKGVHLHDDSVPQDKKNATIDALKETLKEMYNNEVGKIMKNTIFKTNPFKDDGPLKKEPICWTIVNDPKILSEWYEKHDGKYHVRYYNAGPGAGVMEVDTSFRREKDK